MKYLTLLLLCLSLASLLTMQGCYCQLPDLRDPCSRSATQLHDEDIAYFPSFSTPSSPTDPPANGDTPSNRRKRAATSISQLLWPNGVVPYRISNNFAVFEQRLVLEAMKHWENHTCIRFHEWTTQRNFINVFPGSGCCSYVGRVGYGLQGVSIGRSCLNFHTAVHELGHVIGFWHEQSRPDRNEYIDVLYENILPGFEVNFNRRPESDINSLGVGYDYNSIMHYDEDFFQIYSYLDTLRAKDPTIPLGQARQLSKLDIIQTNRLYNCDVNNPPPPGIILPPILTIPPPSLPALPYQCGEIITASSGTFTSPGYPSYPHNLDCVWMIQVPDGFKLKITFEPLRIEYSASCYKDYIKVHSFLDRRDSGRTVCGIYYSYRFVATANVAAVHLHTDHENVAQYGTGYTGFRASFSTVDVNECFQNRCSQLCRNLPGSFECYCRDGFYLSADGLTCFDVNECALENGGCAHNCLNVGGSFYCWCRSGYSLQPDQSSCRLPGTSCAIENGGCSQTCTETTTSKVCSCFHGYRLEADGKTCTDINECASSSTPCSHICTNTRGSYRCDCWVGFYLGTDNHSCIPERTCDVDNGGCGQLCEDSPTHGAECSCRDGYDLANDRRTCVDVNECLRTGTCQYRCENTEGSYRCSCRDGYSLRSDHRSCEDLNECAAGVHQCQFSDFCMNLVGTYYCRCPHGYTKNPDGHTCNDIDECASNYHTCSHTCRNLPGTYECACPVGYVLQDYGTCLDIDECATNMDRCNRHSEATCENTVGSYVCRCLEGYRTDVNGLTCVDIDECAEGLFVCGENTVCVNLEGDYECQCLPGHQLSGDQTFCEASTYKPQTTTTTTREQMATTQPQMTRATEPKTTVDETPSNTSVDVRGASTEPASTTSVDVRGASTEPAATTQTQLPPTSTTDESTTDASTTAVDITATMLTTSGDNPLTAEVEQLSCDQLECDHICSTTIEGVVKCLCRVGYQLTEDGKTCQDIDECIGENDCGHTCTNTHGSYECSCLTGYELSEDEKSCSDINECLDNRAGCSQLCTNREGSYSCNCLPLHYIDSDGHTCIYYGPPTVPPTTTPTSTISITTVTTPTTFQTTNFVTTESTTQPRPSTNAQSPPTSTPPLCGEHLTAPNGSFHTPNWPKTYPVNIDCEWTITVSDDKVIEITFKDKPYGIAGRLPECLKDWIKVYDGLDIATASLWGPFCQFRNPNSIQTSSNQVKVLFHAGRRHNRNKTGFRARYREVDPPPLDEVNL